MLSSQRGRILGAIAESVAEKGFARATVADVISRAGVSRETFYEQFADKEDCFLAALDAGADAMLELIGAALACASGDPVQRLDVVLEAYLHGLAAEPAFAHAYLIDAYGAGPAATARRIELQRRFVDAMATLFGAADAPADSTERFACEALVAAISSLVTARVGAGRADELLSLREPLVALVRRGCVAP